MSEFKVEVIQLGPIEKHPNADSLGITQVYGGYPCIVRLGDYQEGDRAVYLPIDSIVPENDPAFEFLAGHRRIKAKKLRGVFSMGLLIPAKPEWAVGQNVQEEMRIEKWEPQIAPQFATGGECEADPGFLPVFTDIEGFRKHQDVLIEGESVALTEKIHGANGRFLHRDGRLWVGSHKQIKRQDPNNMWWKIAAIYGLEERLAKLPDIAIYGEVFGAVQDLKYGTKPGEIQLRLFDAFHTRLGKYLNYPDFVDVCRILDLPQVPVLYTGPWNKALVSLANGPSTLADHVREGFVVRPAVERWERGVGRVILKLVGEDYLLRKAA